MMLAKVPVNKLAVAVSTLHRAQLYSLVGKTFQLQIQICLEKKKTLTREKC